VNVIYKAIGWMGETIQVFLEAVHRVCRLCVIDFLLMDQSETGTTPLLKYAVLVSATAKLIRVFIAAVPPAAARAAGV
jgi:hypothetical protein